MQLTSSEELLTSLIKCQDSSIALIDNILLYSCMLFNTCTFIQSHYHLLAFVRGFARAEVDLFIPYFTPKGWHFQNCFVIAH